MDMQREDFLKLCKLPQMFYYPNSPYAQGRAYPTRSGMGSANIYRVLTDWFPVGSIVGVEGSNFISRGTERTQELHAVFAQCTLGLLDPKTLETHSLSIFEALAMAELSIKGAKQ